MKTRVLRTLLGLALLSALSGTALDAQGPAGQRRNRSGPFGEPEEARMPDGRSRTLLTLKSDVDKSSQDMAKVLELAKELHDEIERNGIHTVDLRSVQKADEIIRLVKRVKGRLSRSR